MKLSAYKWNLVEKETKNMFMNYGFKTKKCAQEWANAWNKTHDLQLEVSKN